jgi:hypothetical protein
MTRISAAWVLTASVLWGIAGCTAVPQQPHDPFVPSEPPPQRSGRPVYPPPHVHPHQGPSRRVPMTPGPAMQPQFQQPPQFQQSAPQSVTPPPSSGPRMYAKPPTDPDLGSPQRALPQQPELDKFPSRANPGSPLPPRLPARQPAPTETPTESEGPSLVPPEEAPHSDLPSPRSESAVPTPIPEKTFADDSPIELLVEAPTQRPIGSGVTFDLTIKNTSDQAVRNVSVTCKFDDALTFPGSEKKSVTHKIPKIEPGDLKQSSLTLVSEDAGEYQCVFTVQIGSKVVLEKTVAVQFVSRQLDWRLHGPAIRTVGSRAEFNIPLVNVSPTDLNRVVVRVELDSALTVREMTEGGKLDDRSVTWSIDKLSAQEGLLLQLEVECREPTTQACLMATVSGEDLPADDTEANLTVKPLAGVLDVRVQDVNDPIETGEDAELLVTVVNQGLQPATDVALKCVWPGGFDFRKATARSRGRSLPVKASIENGYMTLTPIPRLDPDQRLEFRLVLTARNAGEHQLTVEVTDADHPTPVEVAEPIMVHK